MRWMMVAGVLALSLAGCQQAGEVRTAQSGPQVIPPGTAVMAAADMAPRGYPGRFGFTVREGARVGRHIYLNSHADYRDPRNLSVKIGGRTLRALEAAHGAPLHEALRGKAVEVDGVAMRTKIVFTAGGKPTDKYYYQTHVEVTDPANLHVID